MRVFRRSSDDSRSRITPPPGPHACFVIRLVSGRGWTWTLRSPQCDGDHQAHRGEALGEAGDLVVDQSGPLPRLDDVQFLDVGVALGSDDPDGPGRLQVASK